MAGVVVDTSVWISFFGGQPVERLEEALADGSVLVPPIVAAELISGATSPSQRQRIGELLQDAPVCATPLEHWIAVGDLRRQLSRKGVTVTIPDAHVAQCALDRDAVLLTGDEIFRSMARHVPLRLV